MNKPFLRRSPAFWAAIAPFSFFIIPLLRGRAIFWGLPSLQFIPWRHYAWSLLRQGILPLWNPLNGMGAPLLANYQLAMFYPPAFPLFLLDELWGVSGLAWGFTLLVPVHLAWGAAGMTRFLKQIGAGNRGQIIGGLAFGMSGYLVARGSFFSIIWAAAWLPWVMCWVEKLVTAGDKRETLKTGLTLSLLVAMMLLAGHAQLSWYSLVLAGLWFLFRTLHFGGKVLAVRKIGILAVFGLLAVLMAAIQLFPTFEYLQQSQRASAYDIDSAMVYSFSPLRLLGYLTPELFGNPGHNDFWGYATYWEDAVYIGLAPFLLALTTIGWIALKKNRGMPHRSTAIFLWSISLAGIILALGENTPIFPWLYSYIPTFDMFQAPARWMIWPTFSLSVLAGLAADRWTVPEKKGKVILNLVAFGGIILAFSAGVASLVMIEWEPGIFRGLIYFGLALFATAFTARRISTGPAAEKWRIVAALVIVLDLFAASMRLNPTAPAGIWSTENKGLSDINQVRDGSRVWMYPNFEQTAKYTWYFQFDNFTNRTEWGALRSSQLANLNLLDNVPMVNNFDPMLPARYADWMERMADESPLTQRKWLSQVGAGAEIIPDPAGVMQTDIVPIDAESRFAWSPCAVQAASPEEAFVMTDRQVRGIEESNCFVVESSMASSASSITKSQSKILVTKDDPNRITLTLDSTDAGWLMIRDSWFPGWQASVNDVKTDLVPANYLFKALPVPAGKPQIELEYKPISFGIGLVVSLLSWILCGVAWFSYRRQ